MRALSLAVVLAALLAPVAHAQGTFTLGAGKVVEGALEPGADVVFEMPLLVNQEGFLYAKVIPTPGNAVHDGTRANGSVAEGTGWRVTFALVRDGGERVELGTYADSRASPLVPVAAEERLTLVSTVHVPSDAALGGAEQTVYVAVAYRLEETAAASGSTSGASLDEARALTLRLSNARLPPVQAGPATPDPR